MALRFGAISVIVAGASVAFAQPQEATPVFEVASVRPADPDHSMSISRSGNHLTFSNYSLEMLIEWAYNVRGDRLPGKPKGLNTVRYDVVAVAPEETRVPGTLNRMMQSLLAERFKLAIHRETRELPYYAMVMDKSGLKVHVGELSYDFQWAPDRRESFRGHAG